MLRQAALAPLRLSRASQYCTTPSLATQLVAYARDQLHSSADPEQKPQQRLAAAVAALEHGLHQVQQRGSPADVAAVRSALGQLHFDSAAFGQAASSFAAAADDAARGDEQLVSDALRVRATESACCTAQQPLPARDTGGSSSGAAPVELGTSAGLRASSTAIVAQATRRGGSSDAWTHIDFAFDEHFSKDMPSLPPLAAASCTAALLAAASARLAVGANVDGCLTLCSAAQALSRRSASNGAPSEDALHAAGQLALASRGFGLEIELLRAQAALSSHSMHTSTGTSQHLSAAETHAGEALRHAEAMPAPSGVHVAPVLAVFADIAMAKVVAAASAASTTWQDASGVHVSEGLYRKALTLLSSSTQQPGLVPLLTWRLAEVLACSPNRRDEAQRLKDTALALWHDHTAPPHTVSRPWARQPQPRNVGVLSGRLLLAWPWAASD
jgi:hypothetical protein